ESGAGAGREVEADRDEPDLGQEEHVVAASASGDEGAPARRRLKVLDQPFEARASGARVPRCVSGGPVIFPAHFRHRGWLSFSVKPARTAFLDSPLRGFPQALAELDASSFGARPESTHT